MLPELANLTNLRSLYLSKNQFSGAVPSELGSLPNLELLYLHDNQLSGAIPAELGDLASLFVLDLSRNQLAGRYHPSWAVLSAWLGWTFPTTS